MANNDDKRRHERLVKLTTASVLAASTIPMLACGGLQPSPKGRLVRVNGKTVTAGSLNGTGWTDHTRPDVLSLTPRERQLAGLGWLMSAELEHAAVAAFSDLSRRLMVLGAPSELVEAAHVAALDEIRHARRCFALSGAFLGEPKAPAGFGAIAEQTTPSGELGLVRLAVGSLRDGALGEGVAALTADESAVGAIDPVIASTLRTIAREEAEHAELGWAVVEWTLSVGGHPVRDAIELELRQLESHVTRTLPPIPGVSEARLRELGLLPQSELGQVADQVVELVRLRAHSLMERCEPAFG